MIPCCFYWDIQFKQRKPKALHITTHSLYNVQLFFYSLFQKTLSNTKRELPLPNYRWLQFSCLISSYWLYSTGCLCKLLAICHWYDRLQHSMPISVTPLLLDLSVIYPIVKILFIMPLLLLSWWPKICNAWSRTQAKVTTHWYVCSSMV